MSHCESPSADDFLQVFGLEPVDLDKSMAFWRYVVSSSDGQATLEISFSGLERSFQVVLRNHSREVARVSTELVNLVEFRHDRSGAGLHVVAGEQNATTEIVVTLEPDVGFHWWTLEK